MGTSIQRGMIATCVAFAASLVLTMGAAAAESRPRDSRAISPVRSFIPPSLEPTNTSFDSVREKDSASNENPVAQVLINPLAEDVVHPISQDVISPIVEEVTTPATQGVIQPVVENVVAPVTQDAVVPVVENVAAPVTNNVVAPIAEHVAEPVTQDVVAPVVEGVAAPVTEDVVAPVVEEVVAPAVQPVTEDIVEPVVVEVVAPVVQPVTDIATPIVGDIVQPVTDEVIDPVVRVVIEPIAETAPVQETVEIVEGITSPILDPMAPQLPPAPAPGLGQGDTPGVLPIVDEVDLSPPPVAPTPELPDPVAAPPTDQDQTVHNRPGRIIRVPNITVFEASRDRALTPREGAAFPDDAGGAFLSPATSRATSDAEEQRRPAESLLHHAPGLAFDRDQPALATAAHDGPRVSPDAQVHPAQDEPRLVFNAPIAGSGLPGSLPIWPGSPALADSLSMPASLGTSASDHSPPLATLPATIILLRFLTSQNPISQHIRIPAGNLLAILLPPG